MKNKQLSKGRFTHSMPFPFRAHAVFLKVTTQHDRRETAVLCCGLEKNGMVGAWHGHDMKCVSDTTALFSSNGKDTFLTLSGTARHGTAEERHGRDMGTACYV